MDLSKLSPKQLLEIDACTLCGEWGLQCPVSIDSRSLWLAFKEVLVDLGHYPKNLELMKNNVLSRYNISGEDNALRVEWLEAMEGLPDHKYQKEKAEGVYFIGCVAAYFPMAHKIPQSFVRILERTRVDFTLLGGAEWCCGFPLIGGGVRKEAQELIRHNIEGGNAKGAHSIIFSCPSCYHTWHEDYHTDLKL